MTTTMSDLRKDIVAKILCRVPMTSLRSLRSTCKNWNALSKDQTFGKSVTKKQFLGFMLMDSRVCSLRFNLQGIRNDGDSAADLSIKQVGILDQVEISKVFHCEGLLLCVLKDNSRLLVWNPYMGQTSWIQPRNKFYRLDRYALGYDKKKGIHKILRFIDDYIYVENENEYKVVFEYEIYDFCSDSWRVLDVTPDWDIEYYHRSVSLKGDSYLFAREKCMLEGDEVDTTETADFLLCFDFTAERFGPRLPLPFHSYYEEIVTLSSVRDEQLAVLHQTNWPDHIMEIWVTTLIKPNAVSWTKFLKVDMRPLTGFKFILEAGSFFIDEEEKVAVVFDLDEHERTDELRYQTAHVIGQDAYFKSVNIGGAPNLGKPNMLGQIAPDYCVPLVCSSTYVPKLSATANQPAGEKERKRLIN